MHCILTLIELFDLRVNLFSVMAQMNLPQLQNLIKRDPESYKDEVTDAKWHMCVYHFNMHPSHAF